MTRHRGTFFQCFGTRDSCALCQRHIVGPRMSWACESAFSQWSSYRHMFRRNVLGVPDPFPPFLSTPPFTQPSLQTGIGLTCADPRGGPLFGRMAEQSRLTSYEPKNLVEVSSEHTPIDFFSTKNSFSTGVNDLTTTVAASDIAETIKAEPLISPLYTQEREVSANLRCLKFSACSSNRQPTAANIFKCGKSLANVQFRELLETGAGCRVISKCWKAIVERKKGSWVRSLSFSQHEQERILSERKNVQRREDYLRLRLKWIEEVGKEEILILLSMKPINNLNHRNLSYVRRINGWIKLERETQSRLFGELSTKNQIYQEHHEKDCQAIEELRRICCKQAGRVRLSFLSPIQELQDKVNSFNDGKEFFDPETVLKSSELKNMTECWERNKVLTNRSLWCGSRPFRPVQYLLTHWSRMSLKACTKWSCRVPINLKLCWLCKIKNWVEMEYRQAIKD